MKTSLPVYTNTLALLLFVVEGFDRVSQAESCRLSAILLGLAVVMLRPRIRSVVCGERAAPLAVTLVSAYVIYQLGPVREIAGNAHASSLLSGSLILASGVYWHSVQGSLGERRWGWEALSRVDKGVLCSAAALTILAAVDGRSTVLGFVVPPYLAAQYFTFSQIVCCTSSTQWCRPLKLGATALLAGLALVIVAFLVRMREVGGLAATLVSRVEAGEVDEAARIYRDLVSANHYLQKPEYRDSVILQTLSESGAAVGDARYLFHVASLLAAVGEDSASVRLLERLRGSRYSGAQEIVVTLEFADVYSSALYRLRDWHGLVDAGRGLVLEHPSSTILRARLVVALMRTRSDMALEELLAFLETQGGQAVAARGQGELVAGVLGQLIPAGPGLTQLLDDVSLVDAQWLLSQLDWEVLFEDEEIGQTGVITPVNIFVNSAGFGSGASRMEVGGVPYDFDTGYSVGVIDAETGDVLDVRTFNTGLAGQSERLQDYIIGISPGRIVVACVEDDAAHRLTVEAAQSLSLIGASTSVLGRPRWAHLVIGVKGAPPGTAVERLGSKFVFTHVWVGNRRQAGTQSAGPSMRELLTRRARDRGSPVLFLQGTSVHDSLYLARPGH